MRQKKQTLRHKKNAIRKRKLATQTVQQEKQPLIDYVPSSAEIERANRNYRVPHGLGNSIETAIFEIEQAQAEQQRNFSEIMQTQLVPTLGKKRLKDYVLIFEALRKSGIFEQSTTTKQAANGVDWGSDDVDKEGSFSRTIRAIDADGFPKGLSENIFQVIKILLQHADASNEVELQEIIQESKSAMKREIKDLE